MLHKGKAQLQASFPVRRQVLLPHLTIDSAQNEWNSNKKKINGVFYENNLGYSFLFLQLYGHRKISVLDGGLKKWVADGFETTTDVPEIEVYWLAERQFLGRKYRKFSIKVINCLSAVEQIRRVFEDNER